MKIKKEYGEQIYKAALYSEGTNDFIGRLINDVFNPGWIWENNGFPCNIFTDDKLGFVFEDFEDMWFTADPDLERNENIKDFFNEYVEGGYPEPLYYIHMSPYADGGEYLGINEYTNKTTNCAKTNINLKTKFTEKEIKDKFPIYWGTPLIEEVEE